MSSPLLGIDVSGFQGRPDWRAVARSGLTFAIAKATEGATWTDHSYARNREEIPKAGLVAGAYHFLVTSSSAAAQADHFCRVAAPDAIHALDVEAPGRLDVAGWVARYRTHYRDHPLVIYTGRDLWRRSVEGNGSHWGPLWAAGASPNAYVPGTGSASALWAKVGSARSGLPWGGWTKATFLQFTARASVPGIAGHVDGDAFLGTREQLLALTRSQPAPTPQEDDDMAMTPDERATLVREVADAVTSIKARNPVVVDEGTGAAKLPDGRDIDAFPTVIGEIQHEQRRQAGQLDRIETLLTTMAGRA